ncbi:MAG: hypothetical protein H9802_13480 [Candidatus Phocaeicola faecipullorum]|nr:hypothetical protein [Candidatus Phocaeicola faecipullorum]
MLLNKYSQLSARSALLANLPDPASPPFRTAPSHLVSNLLSMVQMNEIAIPE